MARFGDGLASDVDLVRAAEAATAQALEPLGGRRADLVCVFVSGEDPDACAEAAEVRTAAEMDAVDGLIIPGGESTTMLKLLDLMDLKEAFADFGKTKPVFGTCAGAILMASKVSTPSRSAFQ